MQKTTIGNTFLTKYSIMCSSATASPKLQQLLAGIRDFQNRFYQQDPNPMQDLVEYGQHPKVLVISCSDSRVDPAILMAAEPGDLFTVRHVANLVPPYQQPGEFDGARAAIEYAVRDLQVEHIVILGHAHCGGIKALLGMLGGHKPARDFIGDWVAIASSACYRYVFNRDSASMNDNWPLPEAELAHIKEHQHLVERAAIRGSLDNLKHYPWISERLADNRLSLHGWWFDLETGDLWATDADHDHFLPVLD